ncbi:MAG: N-succinylarginine dihydrolase [Actinomycetota bacterium]
MAIEVNIDGLVGPTHNYAGLSAGNRASEHNAGRTSSPRRAALQGLAKMRRAIDLGLTQGVLPPPLRPDPATLRRLGVGPGRSVAEVLAEAPELAPLLFSASAMWAANAATVTPSVDAADGRLHLTPANLWSTPHRAQEPTQTTHILRCIFADDDRFVVHDALPSSAPFADEGAANHGRFAASHGAPGVHLFVHGRHSDEAPAPDGVPRRQTRLAGRLIAASHGVAPRRIIEARQSTAAIEAGAFHNDVVSVANGMVLFTHERAFEDAEATYALVRERAGAEVVEVAEGEVSLADAIASYLFNSQLLTMPDGSTALLTPAEVEQTPSTSRYLRRIVDDPTVPIDAVHTMDLRESMRNGGGPACLRLRVVMTDEEQAALSGRVLLDHADITTLEHWVERHYRDSLDPTDLTDPALAVEAERALAELADLLDLPGLYRP